VNHLNRQLKNVVKRVNRQLFGPTKRATNDYATHLPVLVGLARSATVRSVLELGCGYYSTLTFLNRDVFPDLQLLHSYETDPRWAAAVKSSTHTDSRSKLNLVDGLIADSLAQTNLEGYDLILIDDSETAADRTKTIRTIVERRPQRPLVVLHDFEVPEYASVAKSFRHRYAFRVFNPETGVVWEDQPRNQKAFRQIDRVLKQHARRIQPDDVSGWVEAFASAVPPKS
jgi:predicted O-methyltransferase YrrM